jgi:hypothetical protein
MAALADKIGNYPVFLPLLNILNFQCRQFRAPQTAAQKNCECGVVSLSAKTANVYGPQKAHTLLCGKPIANRHTQPFGTLHAANSCRQIGAQEPAIRCLIRQPSDCREPQVNGGRSIVLLFERDPVPGDYGLVEGEPRFRTVPVDELSDRMIVGPLRTWRSQLFRTADFDSSRSGSLRTDLGARLRFIVLFAIETASNRRGK